MEAKLETLANGIQKQNGTKSARRLEAAISNMKALERQAAIVQSPLVQRSPAALRSRTAELSPSVPQRNEGLESMRQRLLDMESRARDRAKLLFRELIRGIVKWHGQISFCAVGTVVPGSVIVADCVDEAVAIQEVSHFRPTGIGVVDFAGAACNVAMLGEICRQRHEQRIFPAMAPLAPTPLSYVRALNANGGGVWAPSGKD